ncbi:MAG: PorT family protein [Bacteroidales bacterium]|nr:PorT family protein [Bacteroidales bacterium]
MSKRLLPILLALLSGFSLFAQEEAVFEGFTADTVEISLPEKRLINDYSLIGVNFGPTVSRMLFNPNVKQAWLYNPYYMSVTYTKYMKMFGFLPYFGFQIGLAYGHEGYKFVENPKTHYLHRIEGATEAKYDIVELPFLLHGHVDGEHFKFMINAGPYLAYRLSITRTGNYVTEGLENSFADYDRRWDYGVYAGIGFALVFDPMEIHFNVGGHAWSWGSIYAPNSNPGDFGKYYYRFAYPLDLNATVGVHLQLGKRSGKTSRDLKNEAYEIVYGHEKNNGKGR